MLNSYVPMPVYYVQDDRREREWIAEQLAKLPIGKRQTIADQYSDVYQAAFDAEPVSYRQENAGRVAANTRLREYVKRYTSLRTGETSSPPLVGK